MNTDYNPKGEEDKRPGYYRREEILLSNIQPKEDNKATRAEEQLLRYKIN